MATVGSQRQLDYVDDSARSSSSRSFTSRTRLADGSSVDDLYRAVMKEHGLDQLDQRDHQHSNSKPQQRIVPLRASAEGQRTDQLHTSTAAARSAAPSKIVKRGLWRQTLDPASGKVYYYHKFTKVTCWTPPPAWDDLPDGDAGSVAQKNVSMDGARRDMREAKSRANDDVDASLLREQMQQKKEEERMKEMNRKGRDIRRVVDAQSGRAYFYDRVTRQTFWEDPRLVDLEEEEEESQNLHDSNTRSHNQSSSETTHPNRRPTMKQHSKSDVYNGHHTNSQHRNCHPEQQRNAFTNDRSATQLNRADEFASVQIEQDLNQDATIDVEHKSDRFFRPNINHAAEGRKESNEWLSPDRVASNDDARGVLTGDFEDDSWMQRSHGRASLRASRRQEAEQVLRTSRRMSAHKETADAIEPINEADYSRSGGQKQEEAAEEEEDDDDERILKKWNRFSGSNSGVSRNVGVMSFNELAGQPVREENEFETDIDANIDAELMRVSRRMRRSKVTQNDQPAQHSSSQTSMRSSRNGRVEQHEDVVFIRHQSSVDDLPTQQRLGASGSSQKPFARGPQTSSQNDLSSEYDQGIQTEQHHNQLRSSQTRDGDVFDNNVRATINTRNGGGSNGSMDGERIHMHAGESNLNTWEDEDLSSTAKEEAFYRHRETELVFAKGMIATDVTSTRSNLPSKNGSISYPQAGVGGFGENARCNSSRSGGKVELGEAVNTRDDTDVFKSRDSVSTQQRAPALKSSLRLLKKKIKKVKSSSSTPGNPSIPSNTQVRRGDSDNVLHRARSEGNKVNEWNMTASGQEQSRQEENGSQHQSSPQREAWTDDNYARALSPGVSDVDVPVVASRGAPIACERRTGCPCVDCTQSNEVAGVAVGHQSSFKPTMQMSAGLNDVQHPGASSSSVQDLESCELCGRSFNAKARVIHQRICGKVFSGKKTTATNSSKARLAALAQKNKEQRSKVANSRAFRKKTNWRDQSAQIRDAMKSIQPPSGNETATPPPASHVRPSSSIARMRRARSATPKPGGRGNESTNGSIRDGTTRLKLNKENGPRGNEIHEMHESRFDSHRYMERASTARPSTPTPAGYVQCPHCERSFNVKAGERHIPMCQQIKAKPTTLHRGKGRGAHLGKKKKTNGMLSQTMGTHVGVVDNNGSIGSGGNRHVGGNGHITGGGDVRRRDSTPTLMQRAGSSHRRLLTPTAPSTARLSRGTTSGEDLGYLSDGSYSSPNVTSGAGTIRVSVTQSGVQLTPCPTCQRQFSRKAFDRHVTYCVKQAEEQREKAARHALNNLASRPGSSNGSRLKSGGGGGRGVAGNSQHSSTQQHKQQQQQQQQQHRQPQHQQQQHEYQQQQNKASNCLNTLGAISNPTDLYDALLIQRSKKGHNVIQPSPQRHRGTANSKRQSNLGHNAFFDDEDRQQQWQQDQPEDVDDAQYDRYEPRQVCPSADMRGADINEAEIYQEGNGYIDASHEGDSDMAGGDRHNVANASIDLQYARHDDVDVYENGSCANIHGALESVVPQRTSQRKYDTREEEHAYIDSRGLGVNGPDSGDQFEQAGEMHGVYDDRHSWMYEAAAGSRLDAPSANRPGVDIREGYDQYGVAQEDDRDYGGWTEGARRAIAGSRSNTHEHWDADAFE